MPNCGSNTLYMGRSTNCSVSGGCDNIGPADCLSSSQIGPRRNRGKVIEQIKEYVLLMLGAPTIDLELDEQALDMAVKQTLKVMEYYAPREYFRYYTFLTSPGKSVYEMPPEVGYIRNVYYRQTAEFTFQSTDLDGVLPLEYFSPGGQYAGQSGMLNPVQPIWGHMGEWVLYKMYERMFSRVSSSLGGWEFVGGYRNIKLYPIPYRAYRVIVHYMQRCHDWDEVTLTMQEGALAHAKMMLGTIRKKYQGGLGPSGGLTLDGEAMYQEGKELYQQWKEDLIYRWGEMGGISMG